MKLFKVDKLLLLWTVVILFAIAVPIPPGSPVSQAMSIFDYSDKIVHAILFGVLAFLLAESLSVRNNRKKFVYSFSLLAACLYAVLAELIQTFVPTRTASVADFIAGAIGAVVALLIAYARSQRKK
jgi:VanZ family protein